MTLLHYCTLDLCSPLGVRLLEIAKSENYTEMIDELENEKARQRFSKSKNARNTLNRTDTI